MTRRAVRGLAIAAVAVAAVAAGTFVIGHSAPVDGEQAATAAHRAFLAGLAKGDPKAVGAALDRRFTWTDVAGRTLARRETLEQLSALAAAHQGDRDVQARFYGRLLRVSGRRDDARFLRVFVKRRHGWKAIAVLETPIAAGAGPAAVEPSAAGDCDNPCRSVPYTPKTAMEKDILAAWQRSKLLEWQPDAAQWASFIADECMFVSDAAVHNKDERAAIAKRRQDAGIATPGDPVAAMRIYGVGTDSALMVSRHIRNRGGKPYTAMRIWVLRDGRWQLAWSQQVAIRAAAPVAAIAGKR
jgi:hypothetical protein